MAALLNITIDKGAKFAQVLSYQDSSRVPISLAPYEARMHIRDRALSSTIALELTSLAGDIVLENGGIVGRVDINIGASVTENITIGSGVYDLELYNPLDSDDIIRLVQGSVLISENVTR